MREDGHIPGHVLVPGMATKCGYLASDRQEIKNETR